MEDEKMNTDNGVEAQFRPSRASVVGGTDRVMWTREQVQSFLGVEPQMIYVYVKRWGLKPEAVVGTNYLWDMDFVHNWAKNNQYRRVSTRSVDGNDETISTKELRKRLGISRETLHILVAKGMNPEIKHGRFYRWKYEDVIAWLKENRASILDRMKPTAGETQEAEE